MPLKRKVLIGVAAAALLLVTVGVFLPSTLSVERRALIDAWPATLFVLIDDAERSAAWLPWVAAAEAAEVRASGPAAGAGATLAWEGERPGSRRIVESVPGERVSARLVLDGTPATSVLELARLADGTQVRWRLELDLGNDLPARYRALMAGDATARQLERGLAALETLAENLPRADFGDLEVEALTVEAVPVAWRSVQSRPDPAAVSSALGDAFFDILGFMSRHGLTEAGPPLAIDRGFRGPERLVDAAIPVAGADAATPAAEDGIRLGRTYAGPAIRATHKGAYGDLVDTHRKVAAYLAAHGIERNGDPWEVYVSDPARTPDAQRVTEVYYPVQPRQDDRSPGS